MVVNFTRRLIRSARIAWLLNKAWNSVSEGKSQDAESYFHKIDSLTKNLSAEHIIMKAYIKYKVNKYMEAKDLFDEAWRLIDSDQDLSLDEKLYCKGYILGPAKNSLDFVNFDSDRAEFFNNIVDFSLTDIKLENVRKKWRIHFPLRDHPRWNRH